MSLQFVAHHHTTGVASSDTLPRMRKTIKTFGAALLAAPLVAATLTTGAAADADAVAPKSKTAATRTVRVMTWNIHGAGAHPVGTAPNVDAVARVIKANDIDIVTVQEIFREKDHDLVIALTHALGLERHTNVHFGPADHRGKASDPAPGMAGNAVITRFPIEERVTVHLPNHSNTNNVSRSMAGVRVRLPGGKHIKVYTTHLSPGLKPRFAHERQDQARTALNYIADKPGALLFTGDFNTGGGNPIPTRIRNAGFDDTGNFGDHDGTHGDARIDYIFARNIRTTGGHVGEKQPISDHKPLIVRFRI